MSRTFRTTLYSQALREVERRDELRRSETAREIRQALAELNGETMASWGYTSDGAFRPVTVQTPTEGKN